MCGDSKDEMEKRRARRDKRKKVKQSGSESSSPKRGDRVHFRNDLRASSNEKSGSNIFGEVDKHSDLNLPLLATSLDGAQSYSSHSKNKSSY